MWFMQFSCYKTINRIAPCGEVQCGVLSLAVRCDFAILQVG